MELLVENLGVIKKAKIDLNKNFYLFVGYNNTGKTYLAQLMWNIFNYSLRKKFIEDVNTKNIFNFTDSFEIEKELIDKLLQKFSKFLRESTVQLFNSDRNSSFITKNLFLKIKTENINFIKEKEIKKSSFVKVGNQYIHFELRKIKNSFQIDIIEKELSDELIKFTTDESDLRVAKVKIVIDLIMDLLFGENQKPFYLPATRSSYAVFYQYILRFEKDKKEEMSKRLVELVSDKKNQNISDSLSNILLEYKTSYTKSMDELIDELAKISEKSFKGYSEVKSYQDLLISLEDILGGEIVIKSVEGVAQAEFYLKVEDEKELPMFLSSSSVNQLGTLYLFLKYWAKEKNNFLILDEPEENLHPDNQITLIDILINFANRDNRVLITTHSPLVAESINNHLHLGYLKKSGMDLSEIVKRNRIDMNPNNYLMHDDTAIYAFEKNRVIDYKVEDYGAFFSNFRDISYKIKDINEVLTDEIYRLEYD